MIEPQKLEEIMKRPEAFRLEPKSQVLTVMFIDIVGFSSMAERESPAAVFSQLRELLGMAADMVHKSGGVVDRSLGDGLLCFFGYEFQTSNEYTVNHAEAALKCAAEIQRESLKRDFSAVESGLQAFPLRIGINTGEVYAGDLGGGGKIDFTIIGHSVNFAQRLESACENYRVMCGPSTKDFLPAESQLRAELSKKLINIKHHSELIESYEYDPNHNNFEGRQRLKQLCRKLDVGVRDEVRWPVTPKTEILVAGEFGKGQVTNFSFSGLEINADAYIGKGAVINFEFKTPDGSFEAELKRRGITQITAEVRWSWREGEASHRLGLLFKNISPESKDIIFNYIRETSLAKAN
jgi:class 3 adenylate cyclase